MVGLVKNK